MRCFFLLNRLNAQVFSKQNTTLFGVLVTLIAAVSLTACGYHLRGYTQGNGFHLHAMSHTPIQLTISPSGESLRRVLTQTLKNQGFDIALDTAPRLHVIDVRYTRQTLNGAITEVQLGLETDIVFESSKGDRLNHMNTLRANRNYQYDIKNSNADTDMQLDTTKRLEQDIAEQIVRQLQLQASILNDSLNGETTPTSSKP